MSKLSHWFVPTTEVSESLGMIRKKFPRHKKTPINELPKQVRDKYLSMSYNTLVSEEEKLKKELRENESKLARKIHESDILSSSAHAKRGSNIYAIKMKLEKEIPPVKDGLFVFNWNEKYDARRDLIEKKAEEIFEESKEYEEFRKDFNQSYKLRGEITYLKSGIPWRKQLIDAFPEIKKRVKTKERNAKLAAYEDKSRDIGSNIIRNLRANCIYPYNCPYCENTVAEGEDHADHIHPVSQGGLTIENNIVLICASCNLKKRDLSLRVFSQKNKLDYLKICERLEELGKYI